MTEADLLILAALAAADELPAGTTIEDLEAAAALVRQLTEEIVEATAELEGFVSLPRADSEENQARRPS